MATELEPQATIGERQSSRGPVSKKGNLSGCSMTSRVRSTSTSGRKKCFAAVCFCSPGGRVVSDMPRSGQGGVDSRGHCESTTPSACMQRIGRVFHSIMKNTIKYLDRPGVLLSFVVAPATGGQDVRAFRLSRDFHLVHFGGSGMLSARTVAGIFQNKPRRAGFTCSVSRSALSCLNRSDVIRYGSVRVRYTGGANDERVPKRKACRVCSKVICLHVGVANDRCGVWLGAGGRKECPAPCNFCIAHSLIDPLVSSLTGSFAVARAA